MSLAWPVVALALSLAPAAMAQNEPAPPVSSPQAPARPAIFSDKSFADAVAASKGTGKITIVKATAEWCGPCKAMNRTTMVDPQVVAWFGESAKGTGNGIIIEFDVDRDTKLAQDLNIQAMPTTIAFKDGKEFDRVVGYLNASRFLNWLESVKAGQKASDDLAIKVEKSKQGGERVSMQDRLQSLRNSILTNGDMDKATDEAVWLWNNMVKEEPAMAGVRGSFFAGDIKNLARRHKPAAEAFGRIRDEAWAAYVRDPQTPGPLDDWIVLNDALGQNDRTLEWFDRAKREPNAGRTFEQVDYRLERLLIDKRRVGDICLLYRDPMDRLRRDAMMKQSLPKLSDKEQNQQLQQIHDRMFRDSTSLLYASLLMAGRASDAQSFAVEAIRLDDTGAMRLALVRAALENGVGNREHWEMLDAANTAGEPVDTLREELERQAGKP